MIRACLVLLMILSAAVASADDIPGNVGGQRSISPISGALYQAQDGEQITVFVVGSDSILVADPLNVAFATWLRDELGTRFLDRPVRTVVQTSHLFDRAAGGKVFKDNGATLIGPDTFNRVLYEATEVLSDALAPLDRNHNGRLEAPAMLALRSCWRPT